MQVEIKPHVISEETKKKMFAFFMKTSIPRIIAAEAEKKKASED
ncbi:hypothetical protein [Cytobacillus horneckiae]|nr:hypothetical protein [Cytobacillus horneckiae]